MAYFFDSAARTRKELLPGVASRISYVIGQDGRIAFTHEGSNPLQHVEQTLNAVQKWQMRYEESAKAPPGPVAYPAVGTLYWWPDWLEWLRQYRPANHAYALTWMEAAANQNAANLQTPSL